MRPLPSSHHLAREGKRETEERQLRQATAIRSQYSSSDKMEVLSFHNPGPGGTTSGIDKDRKMAQWSEKGQGMMSQEETEDTQT